MARAFTFIHTADLHLDAPFGGVDAADPRVREALLESTYAAFERVVSLAVERGVDFVVVAGDTYNSRDKSLRAQLRFRSACERLDAAGIPIHLVHGNHDPADGWSAHLALPDNVHYFATDRVERVEVLDRGGAGVLCALLGRSYATAATRANLATGFHRAASDETAIGVLHANVGGQADYEPYAPCTLDDLVAAGLDYWALGHIHKRLDLSATPKIRYSGSPQGLNPKEDGEHGCWLVTMERGQVIAEEFVQTASVRWHRDTIDASALASVDEVRNALRDACERVRAAANGIPAVIRLDLTGRSEAHDALVHGDSFAELVADSREEQLARSPWVWIDRVRDLTGPAIDIEFLRGVEDFTGDLVRIAGELTGDAAACDAFVGSVLADVDASFGARQRDSAALVERARDACLDRLLGGGA